MTKADVIKNLEALIAIETAEMAYWSTASHTDWKAHDAHQNRCEAFTEALGLVKQMDEGVLRDSEPLSAEKGSGSSVGEG